MTLISNEDRAFIEFKYHPVDGSYRPRARFNRYHGYEYDPQTGLDDVEMEEGLKKLFKELEGEGVPRATAKAKAFKFVLDNCRIDVNKNDYFVGIYNWSRPLQNTFIDPWYEEVINERLNNLGHRMDEINATGAASMWVDFDHVVPDWDSLMELGFVGIRDRARSYRIENEKKGELSEKQKAFYDSIEIEYNAILDLIKRFIAYAKEHPSDKSETIIESLERLHSGAPQTFFDALQAMYIYFILCECIEQYQTRSLGNGLDYTLYPFYKKDIESGRYTREELNRFLAYFLMQFSAIGSYWGQPMWVGGTAVNGESLVNQLSYDIIDVYGSLNIYNPKIQIKVNYNTPKDFINKVLELIRKGNNSFVFCSEPGIVKALMGGYGVSYEEAITADISGCCEMHVRKNETCVGTGYINAAKAVVFVFSNGYDTVTKKQVGLKTGDVSEFNTFEDFYAAFLKQWAYLIDTVIDMANEYEPYIDEMNPAVMHSGITEQSVRTMLDGYAKGIKYNTSSLLNCAFATAVDSILAVKELVFDTKQTTLSELKIALENNWKGYEKLRLKALNCRLKYGNSIAEADVYAAALSRWFATYVTGRKNTRGGVYKADMHSALQFIEQGRLTQATPDGRCFGDEYSKNGSPSVGMDRNGATALIKSAIATEPTLYSVSYNLDMMLHPSAVQGEDGLAVMWSLVETYMKNGGLSIQFNIFNAETLKDAQINPEKYKNLQVRVSGWNVLWSNLSKEEQDAYIFRAENIRQ